MTNDFRSINPFFEDFNLPFNTEEGLKEDKTKAGYNPERKAQTVKKPINKKPYPFAKRDDKEKSTLNKRLSNDCEN